MNCPPKKNGRRREVAVSGGSTVTNFYKIHSSVTVLRFHGIA